MKQHDKHASVGDVIAVLIIILVISIIFHG